MSVIKSIIFDMDGTLLDSSYALTCSINFVRKSLGLKPLKKETLEYYINEPDQDLSMIFYGTHEYLDEHREMFKKHYLKTANLYVKPYDGAYDLLEFLKLKKIDLSIATNASDYFAKSMLKHAKMLDYFTLIIGSNNVKNSKPNPDMIDLICGKLNKSKNQTILIGDSIKDELAAKNSNVGFVFANWGYGRSNNSKKFDNIFQLIDYFDNDIL
ncbi:MAG: HAD family hydrolase [Campylobacteraceae bacterium]|nr:HAD family hydrolase [Campylobacteraceae bacterium]